MTIPEGVAGRAPRGGAAPPPDAIPWWRRLSLKLTVAIAVLIFGTILGMTLLGLRAQAQFLVQEAVRGAVLFSDTIRSSTHSQMPGPEGRGLQGDGEHRRPRGDR